MDAHRQRDLIIDAVRSQEAILAEHIGWRDEYRRQWDRAKREGQMRKRENARLPRMIEAREIAIARTEAHLAQYRGELAELEAAHVG